MDQRSSHQGGFEALLRRFRIIKGPGEDVSQHDALRSAAEKFFDAEFYAEGFAAEDLPEDLLHHYLTEGWCAGKDPAPWFSTNGYLEAHPDVATTGANPLVHYALHGADEGRLVPSPAERRDNRDLTSPTAIANNSRMDKSATPADDVTAYIEGGLCSSDGSGGLVFGWALCSPDASVHIVTCTGEAVRLSNCFRRIRDDVRSAFPDNKWSGLPSGFIGFVPGLTSSSEVRVVSGSPDDGTVVTARKGNSAVQGDVMELARRIFSIETPPGLFAERTVKADWPLLSRCLAKGRETRTEGVCEVELGSPPGAPRVSIVVPLYGRLDFIEAQIMEFARDSFIRDSCEVVFVVDDPPRWAEAEATCRSACNLFDFGAKLVGNGANNGFSGANNLGIRASSADRLLFLNSDVIPEAPGWVEQLLETLDSAPDIGAVGARLVFPDGGIQHAGLDFRFNEDWKIWTNVHRGKGFAPELDAGPETEEVAAVTGACLLISREHLEAVGGWDEGYLLGDFEDSHLCLALRARGLRIFYDRRPQLVHLERQSFGRLGEADFRQKVVIANAARHQSLWGSILESREGDQ